MKKDNGAVNGTAMTEFDTAYQQIGACTTARDGLRFVLP